eukprot:TRINITY_DN1856_c0_g1_i2.p1 TRINITY_DN1856_c0_g1~~TRINITY_DN1856_c0_g1_i2.p1  ORF type:complete len:320 (+),score=81.63 TRINITY_DN1856_c0_g1_i2:132-1091(+)
MTATDGLAKWITETAQGLSAEMREGVRKILTAPEGASNAVTAATLVLALAHIDRQQLCSGWMDQILGTAGGGGATGAPALVPPTGAPIAGLQQITGQSGQQLTGPYTGTLVRIHDKGFGFLECQALQQQYGRDVLVQRSECEQLTRGDQVQFFAEISQDGKLTARQVVRMMPLSPSPHGQAGLPGVTGLPGARAAGIGVPGGMWPPGIPATAGATHLGAWPPSGGLLAVTQPLGMPPSKRVRVDSDYSDENVYYGTLARKHDKGFGFIDCAQISAQYGRNALVPQSECQVLDIGDPVQFRIRRDAEGKITALDTVKVSQ